MSKNCENILLNNFSSNSRFRMSNLAVLYYIAFSLCLQMFQGFVECHEKDKHFNRTLFALGDVKHCAKSDFYDLNYFACLPCRSLGENLQPSFDKFSCSCKMSSLSPTVATIFDVAKSRRSCMNICNETISNSTKNVTILTPHYCQIKEESLPKLNCKFKYINRTKVSGAASSEVSGKSIELTNINWQYDGQCDKCDVQYNFHYQDYCIANSLLRPYLGYNSFWQATTQHFGELKFVAFFCLALNNQTSCQHLANLCVLSFYSFDKNSPCSKFLLSQASDVVYRYGGLDDQIAHRSLRPLLFYHKGKEMAKELREPLRDLELTLSEQDEKHNRLHFFSVSYGLEGSLQRWGNLKFSDLNLCPYCNGPPMALQKPIRFGVPYTKLECDMSLSDILDMAKAFGNQRFMSLYLNYTRKGKETMLLRSIPILVEDLSPENKRPQKEDWQLVTRFQMLEVHPRHGSIASKASPSYEDAHKLLLYRSLRYVERLEIHYEIHDHNQISLPVVKLRYRHIEFTNNTTLGMPLKFQFLITNERIGQASDGEMVNEIALPLLLLLALVGAFLKANAIRKRRAASDEICQFAFFTELLLYLISYMALAFLLCFLLHTSINALTYLTQSTVHLTLPIVRDLGSLKLIVYAAFVLKVRRQTQLIVMVTVFFLFLFQLIFLFIYLRHLAHFNIFFIDWERPRCGDTNHFNLKNNLETSSVCSSVRTFISDSNVSAWRSILLANEWIQLSGQQKTSMVLQGLVTYGLAKLLHISKSSHDDITLQLFFISLIYLCTYIVQYLLSSLVLRRIMGNPLQKYAEHCSLANISVFALLEPSYGYYVHGRSPHGFADSDMATMLMQLQRETQSMSGGRRGLLSDSDQCYIVMPPRNLCNYYDKMLLPYQRSFSGWAGAGAGAGAAAGSHAGFAKEIGTVDGSMEKMSLAYASLNRFFCAFIDHGIKDMDYIIKEKTFLEQLCSSEFDRFVTDSRGTFYIDNAWSFGQLFLYGNEGQLFILHFLLFLAIFLLTHSLLAAVCVICVFNKILQLVFVAAVRDNICTKTLIDKRFYI